MATGQLARPGGPLDTLAEEHGASPSQLALAWLLHRSPVMLPIPGVSRVTHVEENTEAAQVTLNDTEHQALSRAVWPAHTPGANAGRIRTYVRQEHRKSSPSKRTTVHLRTAPGSQLEGASEERGARTPMRALRLARMRSVSSEAEPGSAV